MSLLVRLNNSLPRVLALAALPPHLLVRRERHLRRLYDRVVVLLQQPRAARAVLLTPRGEVVGRAQRQLARARRAAVVVFPRAVVHRCPPLESALATLPQRLEVRPIRHRCRLPVRVDVLPSQPLAEVLLVSVVPVLLAPHFEVVARACRVRSRARQRARRDLASVLPSPLASGWGGGRRAHQGEGAAARHAMVVRAAE